MGEKKYSFRGIGSGAFVNTLQLPKILDYEAINY